MIFCIIAVLPAALTGILDFILYYFFLKEMRAIRNGSLFPLLSVLIPIILSGAVFIVIEIILWLICKKKELLEKKTVHIGLLIGAVVYALLTAFVFPMSQRILYPYLPGNNELAADLSLLFFQLSSYAAAVLCGIVNGVCAKFDKIQ